MVSAPASRPWAVSEAAQLGDRGQVVGVRAAGAGVDGLEPFARYRASSWWTHWRDTPNLAAAADVDMPGNVTRPTRDGGRDALGQLAVGPASDPIRLHFALEAKCYEPGNSVGVKEIARLVSRIKHREFGVIVTTSYVHEQAYREIREGGHPIIVFSGADIVNTLRAVGITTIAALRAWLTQEFPFGESLQLPAAVPLQQVPLL